MMILSATAPRFLRSGLCAMAPSWQGIRRLSVAATLPGFNEIKGDPTQVKLLEERCILVDEKDRVIGEESKKNCHLLTQINGDKALHRAFSVFLFNSQDELLIQKRASDKIIFPSYWANTCCSHPLHVPEELDETNNVGVKRAARRKLQQELGIDSNTIELDSLVHLTRILYKSPCDNMWGEHEVDHLLVLRGDYDLNLNPNEVAEVRYLKADELARFLAEGKEGKHLVSPWFQFISSTLLPQWWENLSDLKRFVDSEIHNFVEA